MYNSIILDNTNYFMIKYCCNCVYPEIKPDLTFDQNEMCDTCRFVNVKDTTV